MPDDFPIDKALLHSNSAICLMKMQRYDEAEGECSAAIELNPKLVKALANRAECKFQSKNYQKALEGCLIRYGGSREAGPNLPEPTKTG